MAGPTPIIALAGQSNSVGEGNVAGMINFSALGLDQPFPAVQYLEKTASAPADPLVWDVANRGPIDLQARGDSGCGIEISLGRRLVNVHGIKVNIAKMAIVASSLSVNWAAAGGYPVTPPYLADQWISFLQGAETSLNGFIAGVVWQQGEADAGLAAGASYDTNLKPLIDKTRAVWPNLWWLLVQLHYLSGGTFNSTVRDLEARVVSGYPRMTMVSGDALPITGAHYLGQSCYDLGNIVGDRVAALMRPVQSYGGLITRGYTN